MIENLKKSELKQVANYLALIHVSGYTPCGMRKGSNWSTDVLIGYTFEVDRFVLKAKSLPLVEDHPLVTTVRKLESQGFRVSRSCIMEYRRWTVGNGVPLIHTSDMRKIIVYLDGRAAQYHNAEGRFEYKVLDI